MITGFKPHYTGSNHGEHVQLGMPLDHDDIKAALRDNPEVTHVFIPQTWFGYGADLVMLANNEALERDYGKRVHTIGTELAFTRLQVIRFSELWDIIAGLAYDYASYDDTVQSRMVSETCTDYAYECLTDELWKADIEYDNDTVRQWLEDNRVLWDDDSIMIDSDGLTPYMSKVAAEALKDLYLEN